MFVELTTEQTHFSSQEASGLWREGNNKPLYPNKGFGLR